MPPNSLLHRGRGLKALILAALALVAAGCAKFPDNGASGGNTQIRFSMTVRGRIKPNYIYVVAIRWAKDNPPFDRERGPIPVIAQPWGNGIVAGRANVYVKWDAFQSPEYQIFEFLDPIPDDQFPDDDPPPPPPYLMDTAVKGIPLNVTDIGENSRTIEFTLDLSQIAQNAGDIPLLRNLQVNFLTMDRVPQSGDSGSKVWDGIGDNGSIFDINNFLEISLDQNRIYTNATYQLPNIEPIGDTPDPDLDIENWAIQVTRP